MLYYILLILIICVTGVWIYKKKEEEDLLYTEEVTIMGKRTLRHYYKEIEIWEIFEALSPKEAQSCIDIAEHLAKTTKLENKRLNMIARITKEKHRLVENLGKTISKLMETPIKYKEQFGIYKYIPEKNIEGHYDGCYTNKDEPCAEVDVSNIIFLNGDYQGGSIYFRLLDLMIRPEIGKMVMFKNYDKNKNRIKHVGFESTKVLNGMQYLLR